MSEEYSISTRQLLGITLKEMGKGVPILGAVIGSHDSVFGAIELNRVKIAIAAINERLEVIEKQTARPCVLDQYSGQVLLYGCDQARHDPQIESKAKAYGGVVAHYMTTKAELGDVVEVLDNLHKLNANDLKLLYSLKSGHQIYSNRRVDEMIGYTPYIQPFSDRAELEARMTAALPSFKRLEALGVIYLNNENVGGIIHQIGSLSGYMSMFAHLTPAGGKLIRALP